MLSSKTTVHHARRVCMHACSHTTTPPRDARTHANWHTPRKHAPRDARTHAHTATLRRLSDLHSTSRAPPTPSSMRVACAPRLPAGLPLAPRCPSTTTYPLHHAPHSPHSPSSRPAPTRLLNPGSPSLHPGLHPSTAHPCVPLPILSPSASSASPPPDPSTLPTPLVYPRLRPPLSPGGEPVLRPRCGSFFNISSF